MSRGSSLTQRRNADQLALPQQNDLFFLELKRRNGYKVAVAIVPWLLIQIATQAFAFFEIPQGRAAGGFALVLSFHSLALARAGLCPG